jgi:hypothetical protein
MALFSLSVASGRPTVKVGGLPDVPARTRRDHGTIYTEARAPVAACPRFHACASLK